MSSNSQSDQNEIIINDGDAILKLLRNKGLKKEDIINIKAKERLKDVKDLLKNKSKAITGKTQSAPPTGRNSFDKCNDNGSRSPRPKERPSSSTDKQTKQTSSAYSTRIEIKKGILQKQPEKNVQNSKQEAIMKFFEEQENSTRQSKLMSKAKRDKKKKADIHLGSSKKAFQTFGDWMLEKKDRKFFSCGCADLDSLLKCGIESGRLSMFFGEPNSGKTTIVYSIFLMALKDDCKCVLIDPEHKIDLDQAWGWAKHLGVSEEVFAKGSIERTKTSKEMLLCLESILQKTKKGFCYDLIVVDGIYSNARLETSSDNSSAKAVAVASVISILKEIIQESDEKTCVVVTNQVYKPWGPGAGKTGVDSMGGYMVKHAVSAGYVMQTELNDDGVVSCRKIKRVNTTHAPVGVSRNFKITKNGIANWIEGEKETATSDEEEDIEQQDDEGDEFEEPDPGMNQSPHNSADEEEIDDDIVEPPRRPKNPFIDDETEVARQEEINSDSESQQSDYDINTISDEIDDDDIEDEDNVTKSSNIKQRQHDSESPTRELLIKKKKRKLVIDDNDADNDDSDDRDLSTLNDVIDTFEAENDLDKTDE